MLPKLLLSMILAGIVTTMIFQVIVKVFEWRFLSKAESIFMLYECIYPMLEYDFNNDKAMKVFVKFQHGRCKIKFHDAVEAGLRFELLVHRAFRSYRIVEYVMSIWDKDLEGSEMLECKEELDKICCEVRTLVNKAQEK